MCILWSLLYYVKLTMTIFVVTWQVYEDLQAIVIVDGSTIVVSCSTPNLTGNE